MTTTFFALAKEADYEAAAPAGRAEGPPVDEETPPDEEQPEVPDAEDGAQRRRRTPLALGGLVYNIQIQLPESRDPAVYDALFTSLRAHLLS